MPHKFGFTKTSINIIDTKQKSPDLTDLETASRKAGSTALNKSTSYEVIYYKFTQVFNLKKT